MTIDHLLPKLYNGLDNKRNIIWVCRSCNSSRGSRRPYEYYACKGGVEKAKYGLPRIAEGKYLKFAFEILEGKSLLDMKIDRIIEEICPNCDLKKLCVKGGVEGRLSPLCIDGILTLCFEQDRGSRTIFKYNEREDML
ncbi:MAG: HNH endonuclease [Nitrososphaeria archaeon]